MINSLIDMWITYEIIERDENGNPTYVDSVQHHASQDQAMRYFNSEKYRNGISNNNIKIDSISDFVYKFHITGEIR